MSDVNEQNNPMLSLIDEAVDGRSTGKTQKMPPKKEKREVVPPSAQAAEGKAVCNDSNEDLQALGQKRLDSRFDKIWNSAWKGQSQPDDLTFGEKTCFIYAMLLAKMYYAKMLTTEEGIQYKEELRAFFMYNHEQEETLLKCGTAIKMLQGNKDPDVQKVVRAVNQMFTDDRLPWCS